MNETERTTNAATTMDKGGRRDKVELVYRRRRGSKGRRAARAEAAVNEVNDREEERKPRTTNRRVERLMGRLYKDNETLRRMLDGTENDRGIAERLKQNELLVSKMYKEYAKLEKSQETVHEQCSKLVNLVESREIEHRQLATRCETLENALREAEETKRDLLESNRSLQEETVRSEQDVTLLKNLVYRLNRELERYQDKLWQCSTADPSGDNENAVLDGGKVVAKSWGGVEFHALAPLLNAYDENLSEKQELLTEYERHLSSFGGRCKDVVTENERLHREIGDLGSKCNRYQSEIDGLVDRAESLRKENAALLKEALTRKKSTQEIRYSYERHVEAILERNDALQRTSLRNTAELNDLRGRYEVLSKEYEQMKSKEEKTVPLSVHTAALDECKELLEQLKIRYESEQKKLYSQVKRAEEAEPESENRLAVVTAERNHLKSLNKSLEKNLRKVQRKFEYTQNILHRVQLSRDTLKEQLNKTALYCEELFAEYERVIAEREKLAGLLRETAKENASIDRLGKNITDRMNGLRDQLRVVQRSANAVAVAEKRVKQQEARVNQIKREYRLKVRRLNKLIRQKENQSSKVDQEKREEAARGNRKKKQEVGT